MNDEEKRARELAERKARIKERLGADGGRLMRQFVERAARGMLDAAALEREAARVLPDAQTPEDRSLLGGMLGALAGKVEGAATLLARAAYARAAREAPLRFEGEVTGEIEFIAPDFLPGGSTCTLESTCSSLARPPLRLFVPPSIACFFVLETIEVDGASLITAGDVPCEVFQREGDTGMLPGVEIGGAIALSGAKLMLRARNLDTHPHRFRALALWGLRRAAR